MVEEVKNSPENLIVLRNLTKKFGSMLAVNDVSLVIEKGKIHTIIGPNGAGKTTLFNLICGNLRCTSGQILLLGEDITKLPEYKRARMGLARSFQINNLFPDFTLAETLLLTAGPKKVGLKSFQIAAKKSDTIHGLLEEFKLTDRLRIETKNLSYGEQRQVEVILGLLLAPRVLLLDEPTSGLSPAETSQMCDIIRKVAESLTVVLIEHDLDVVFELSNKISVMNYGRIIYEGTTNEVKASTEVKEAYFGG
jgi:branched-chain amino acid transport system ATP-binding protein